MAGLAGARGHGGAGALARSCPAVHDLLLGDEDARTGWGLTELVDFYVAADGAGKLASAYSSGSYDHITCIQLEMCRPWTGVRLDFHARSSNFRL